MVDALSVALRALSFISLFQAAGAAIFIAVCGRELDATEPALRRLARASALAAIIFVLAHYALEAARMSGDFAGVMNATYQGMVMRSATSVALLWRVIGLLLIVAGLRNGRPFGVTVAVIGAVLALAAFSFVGHTSTHADRWLLSPLLLVHLLIVAFWFGALLPLYFVSAREPRPRAGNLVEGFSQRAVWLVPALFVAGLLLAAMLLPDLSSLTSTTYGQLLLVKLTLFCLLMLLAAFNKWRLGPGLGRGETQAATYFRRALVAEFVLIAAVLCATAVLTAFYSPEG